MVHIIIYPTKTLDDASNFKEQLIQSYAARGYTTYKITNDYWIVMLLEKNNHVNVHVIGAMDTEWGFPATIDEGTTVG